MKELKNQDSEFRLWGWTEPFRARFLLFALLGLASVIAWQDMQARSERAMWQAEVRRLQEEIEKCLKHTADKIEQLTMEQNEYIKQFDRRASQAERAIKRRKR